MPKIISKTSKGKVEDLTKKIERKAKRGKRVSLDHKGDGAVVVDFTKMKGPIDMGSIKATGGGSVSLTF